MFRKTANIFGVLILLFLSFNTYSLAKGGNMLTQTFTQEEMEEEQIKRVSKRY